MRAYPTSCILHNIRDSYNLRQLRPEIADKCAVKERPISTNNNKNVRPEQQCGDSFRYKSSDYFDEARNNDLEELKM